MIYIFIDDADLKPQIINDLIFLLPKYLSHPNVVVFVSASQKTLKYAVKNHMFRSLTENEFRLFDLMEIKQNYMPTDEYSQTIRLKELCYGKEYDKIDCLTEDILQNIFPVYNRFYIKSFDSYSDKAQIFLDDNITIKKLISDALKSFREKFLKSIEVQIVTMIYQLKRESQIHIASSIRKVKQFQTALSIKFMKH